MQRADQLLTEKKLAASRSQAQRLISAGSVEWHSSGQDCWQTVQKPGQLLPATTVFRLNDASETRYVSRGGLKLAGALQHSQLAITGWHCLDIGQSTGGFTDCLLQHGAGRVVGVDVGHNQLHPQLRDNPRVNCIEKVNARELPLSLLVCNDGKPFDLVVMDVSFISQTLIVPSLAALIKHGGYALNLVKPQFEAGPDAVNKKGLIKKTDTYPLVEQRIREAYESENWEILDYFPSAITGGDGNREFFILAKRA